MSVSYACGESVAKFVVATKRARARASGNASQSEAIREKNGEVRAEGVAVDEHQDLADDVEHPEDVGPVEL